MKTETKHNLVLRKETSKQGYFTYKVVDPATGRVIAKRTATRHFVAALFQLPVHPAHAHGLKTSGNLLVTTRPIKIANCFGRTDLIQTTMCKDKYWTAGEVDQLLQGNVVKGYMLATIDPAEVNLNMNIEATTETEAWKQKAKAAEKELKELQEEHEALKEQVAELEYQGEEDRKTIARQSGRIINLKIPNDQNLGFETLSEAIVRLDELATEEDEGTRHLKIQQWMILLAFAKDYQWESNYHQALFQRAADLLRDDNMVNSEVLAMQEADQENELDELKKQSEEFITKRRATLNEDLHWLNQHGLLSDIID